MYEYNIAIVVQRTPYDDAPINTVRMLNSFWFDVG